MALKLFVDAAAMGKDHLNRCWSREVDYQIFHMDQRECIETEVCSAVIMVAFN